MSCCSPKSEKTECCSTEGGCPCCGGECKCGPGCPCKTGACAPKDKGCSKKKCCGVLLGGLLSAMIMFLFEGFYHGQYLMPIYLQTASVWRSMAEMQSLMGWYVGVLVATGLILSFLFSRNYENKGVPEGVRFGFYVGLLIGVTHFCAYVHLPIPLSLAVLWLLGWIVEGVLVGITLALTYMAIQKKPACGSSNTEKSCH